MYSVVQYTNYRKNVEIQLHGVSASLEKAVARARELAEQYNKSAVVMDGNDADYSCYVSTARVLNNGTGLDLIDIDRYVYMVSGSSSSSSNHLGEENIKVETGFIPAQVTLCKNDQAIHNLWYNAHRLYSGFHQNMRAIDHPDARGISLAYMLREVMMPEAHLYPKDMHAERKAAYESMLTQLEARGFNMSLLYMKQDDVKECVQKGTLPAKDKLADIGMVRRILAYVWKHGGKLVQTYMEDKNLADICYTADTIFAIVSIKSMDG